MSNLYSNYSNKLSDSSENCRFPILLYKTGSMGIVSVELQVLDSNPVVLGPFLCSFVRMLGVIVFLQNKYFPQSQ